MRFRARPSFKYKKMISNYKHRIDFDIIMNYINNCPNKECSFKELYENLPYSRSSLTSFLRDSESFIIYKKNNTTYCRLVVK